MPIHITVRFEAAPGNGDEMERTLEELGAHSRAEKGALVYDFYRSGDKFMSMENWADQESLNAHMGTEYFKITGAKLNKLAAGEMEVITWQKVK